MDIFRLEVFLQVFLFLVGCPGRKVNDVLSRMLAKVVTFTD